MTDREELLQILTVFKAYMDCLMDREGTGYDLPALRSYLEKPDEVMAIEDFALYHSVVSRIRELQTPTAEAPRLQVVFADVAYPTCACGQVFGEDWTAGDAVEHQHRGGHEGFRFLLPFPRKKGVYGPD